MVRCVQFLAVVPLCLHGGNFPRSRATELLVVVSTSLSVESHSSRDTSPCAVAANGTQQS